MTAVPPHIQQTLEDLHSKLAEREDAVREMKKQINAFRSMFGLPAEFDEVDDGAAAKRTGAVATFRKDEFANTRSPGVAVRELLELWGKDRGAIPIDEVYRLLRDHGYPFDQRMSDEKARSTVRIAIGKDRKLTKHANDTVGLEKWYPNRRSRTAKAGGDQAEGEGADESDETDDDDADDDNANGTEGTPLFDKDGSAPPAPDKEGVT